MTVVLSPTLTLTPVTVLPTDGCSTTVLLLAAQTVVGIRLNTITRQSSSAVILFFIKNTSSFH